MPIDPRVEEFAYNANAPQRPQQIADRLNQLVAPVNAVVREFNERERVPLDVPPTPWPVVFIVTLSQDGGSAGSTSGACSYTYTLYSRTTQATTGEQLDTHVALIGNGQRVVNAAMTAGTMGMAFYDNDNKVKLIWADEKLQQTNCS